VTTVAESPSGFRSRDARGLPLPPAARVLFVGVAATAVLGTLGLEALSGEHGGWLAFAVFASCAGAAQLFTVHTGRNHGFHTALVFVLAAVLLLPPELVALMAVVQHVPEWVKERYPWYVQTFNTCNVAVDGLAAWVAARAILALDPGLGSLDWALAGLAAAVVLVTLNHLLLAAMLRLARGHSFAESGLLSPAGLAPDLVLAGLGIGLALVWRSNPWVTPALVAPLVLSHRSFALLALLRASEERFAAMFESAALGTSLIDAGGTIVTTNRALEDMLGATKEELRDRPLAAFLHPDDAPAELERFAELMTGSSDRYTVEHRFVGRRGPMAVREAVALVRNADGRPEFAIAMFEDVTERLELEGRLRQAQKMEAIGQLAGGVAHDFNNMLTAISGYSEFALGRLGDAESAVRGDIEQVQRAAQRARDLTRQLLAFSRKQILQPKVVDVNDVVTETDKLVTRLIGEDIEVKTALEVRLGRVQVDPGQLQQVLVNLVVNARDAMPAGGTVTVTTANADLDDAAAAALRPIEPGRYVVLSVCDTGHGMDDEVRSHVFEPFFTTKEQGKGTGLGLATVYGIVKQSGGWVFVDSAPGAGSTFSVYLPRLDDDPEEERDAPPDEAAPGSETVLLVEDEEIVRNLVQEVLAAQGYTVLAARDGQEALEATDRHDGRIHLLLTDVVMPRMSGREVADRLRERRPETRVLFMTGYTDHAIVQEGVLDPGTELLEKPFTFDTLQRKVRNILDEPAAA
jgi:PAS domain S-box-containing protein